MHQLAGYLTERLPENQRVQIAGVGPDNPPGIEAEGRTVFVRNLDPEESGIERATPEQFRAAFELQDVAVTGDTTGASGADVERPDELWTYLAWILLALLLVELFVANRTSV